MDHMTAWSLVSVERVYPLLRLVRVSVPPREHDFFAFAW